MKLLLLFAIASLSLASGVIIPSGKLPIWQEQPVVYVNVTTAHLPRPIKAVLHVFIIAPQTIDQKFELPLSEDKLNQKVQKFAYRERSNGLITFDPTFNYDFYPKKRYFNRNSHLAFEIWDNTTSALSYVGGIQLTVMQLERLPRSTSLKLLDVNGQTAGTIDVQYKVPNNRS